MSRLKDPAKERRSNGEEILKAPILPLKEDPPKKTLQWTYGIFAVWESACPLRPGFSLTASAYDFLAFSKSFKPYW